MTDTLVINPSANNSLKHLEVVVNEEPRDSRLATLPNARKNMLLGVFCLAQFLETFNNSALFTAMPTIATSIGLSNANAVWLLSAYQLTCSAALLTSGRLSDIYSGNHVFIAGAATMGFLSLGAGFVREAVALIVLRAFIGIGAAMTIPSALQLIIALFPDPVDQSRAISIFSGISGIGNILGLFIGALLVTFATWPWVFFFVAIVGILSALVTFLLIPRDMLDHHSSHPISKFKRLDPVGVTILTISLVLFVFAVTSGSLSGWGSAKVIANLVISILLFASFLWWESHIPSEIAALPPKMWHYKNFGILVAVGLLPFMWWATAMILYSWVWQEVYGWSAITTAVHFLPIGLMAIPIFIMSDIFQKKYPLKWVLMTGLVLAMLASAMLPFADSKEKYWRLTFPGLLLGTAGIALTFTTSSIAIFKVTPPEVAGTVGAVFNCVLNLGSATGLAIITSIQTTVEQQHGGPTSFSGRSAGFWFLFAVVTSMAISVLFVMENNVRISASQNMETEMTSTVADVNGVNPSE
ncbi:MFS general substrate transporter [Mycena floridula]|nr:MFS general substrate transporter [Mycena floridula]